MSDIIEDNIPAPWVEFEEPFSNNNRSGSINNLERLGQPPSNSSRRRHTRTHSLDNCTTYSSAQTVSQVSPARNSETVKELIRALAVRNALLRERNSALQQQLEETKQRRLQLEKMAGPINNHPNYDVHQRNFSMIEKRDNLEVIDEQNSRLLNQKQGSCKSVQESSVAEEEDEPRKGILDDNPAKVSPPSSSSSSQDYDRCQQGDNLFQQLRKRRHRPFPNSTAC